MKRHRRMIVSCLALAALASVIALSSMLVGSGVPKVAPESAQAAVLASAPAADTSVALPEVVMNADFAVGYSSIGQLKEAADLVVRGEVVDVSYLDFNSCAYTKVTLKVSKCFKGGAAEGDEITILEVGGVTTMATIKGDKFGTPTKEDSATKVKVLLDGAPLTREGETCLYFLGQGSIGIVSGDYYVPMGAFQGRFKIDNGAAKRFVPTDWQGGKYTALSVDESSVDNTVTQAAAE
jgi:hypothetical protein